MSDKNREYRCTRTAMYLHECLGQNNLRVRQGYYIVAKDEFAAREAMQRMFPEDANNCVPYGTVPFTVHEKSEWQHHLDDVREAKRA